MTFLMFTTFAVVVVGALGASIPPPAPGGQPPAAPPAPIGGQPAQPPPSNPVPGAPGPSQQQPGGGQQAPAGAAAVTPPQAGPGVSNTPPAGAPRDVPQTPTPGAQVRLTRQAPQQGPPQGQAGAQPAPAALGQAAQAQQQQTPAGAPTQVGPQPAVAGSPAPGPSGSQNFRPGIPPSAASTDSRDTSSSAELPSVDMKLPPQRPQQQDQPANAHQQAGGAPAQPGFPGLRDPAAQQAGEGDQDDGKPQGGCRDANLMRVKRQCWNCMARRRG